MPTIKFEITRPYPDAGKVERTARSLGAAEAAAKALAAERSAPFEVYRVTTGPNLAQREWIGTARTDAFDRCWFDLTPHGAPLI